MLKKMESHLDLGTETATDRRESLAHWENCSPQTHGPATQPSPVETTGPGEEGAGVPGCKCTSWREVRTTLKHQVDIRRSLGPSDGLHGTELPDDPADSSMRSIGVTLTSSIGVTLTLFA